MRVQNRKILVVFFAIFLSASVLGFMTHDQRYVAIPGLACVVIALWLWMTLWDRDHEIPFFDIGVLCTLSTLVYTVYPLVNYWAGGLQFDFLSDSRLRSYHISSAELGFFHLRHVLYLFSFVIFYSVFRGRGNIIAGNVVPPRRSTQLVIVFIFLMLSGYFFLLGMLTDADYIQAKTYGDRIAIEVYVTSNMPLLLLQISNKLRTILFIFKLSLLFIVVSQCRKKKWLIILLLWVSAEIIQTIYIKGPRTGLVLFLMAAALFYHRTIKPLSMKFLITSGISLFIFFIFYGIYRGYTDFASLQTTLSHTGANILSGSNEFQALLGTEYDVLQRKIGGANLPWYLYINDFIAILPPQQLMPFEKITASEWYLRQIGSSGTGLGFMWGVISQSIVGFDWIEIAIRGALLGYILARFHHWYLKHQTGFLVSLLYVFFCLKVYDTFRNTTFSLLTNIVWEIIPFYLLILIGRAILSIKVGNQSGHRIAIPSIK